MSNILIAIKNLIKNKIFNLTEHYKGRNRINSVGNSLEEYIKDIFADTLSFTDEYSRLNIYNDIFHIQEIKIIHQI